MIPRDELAHYQDAEDRHEDHRLDRADTEAVEHAKAAHRKRMYRTAAGAKALMEADPDFWRHLEAQVLPRAGARGVRQPGDLTFAEQMAFRAGQQALVDWIRLMAEWRPKEAQDG